MITAEALDENDTREPKPAVLGLAYPRTTAFGTKLTFRLPQSSNRRRAADDGVRHGSRQACAAYIDGAWPMWIAIKTIAHAPTCAMGDTPPAQAVDWFKNWYEHASEKDRQLPAVVGIMAALRAINPRGCP